MDNILKLFTVIYNFEYKILPILSSTFAITDLRADEICPFFKRFGQFCVFHAAVVLKVTHHISVYQQIVPVPQHHDLEC